VPPPDGIINSDGTAIKVQRLALITHVPQNVRQAAGPTIYMATASLHQADTFTHING